MVNILDYEEDEPKKTKREPEAKSRDTNNFDAMLDMEQSKWRKQGDQDLTELLPKVEQLAQVGVTEAYPRKSVQGEDPFMTLRRARITDLLMATGNQGWVDKIKAVLKIFDNPEAIELERDTIIKKLGTYGADAGDLIGWIACCEFLVGSNKREGLLQIQLDKTFYAKQEEALKKVVEFQASIDAGIDAKGVVKKMAPSSMLISAEMVKGWIVNNVPEYSELRKDIAVLGTISETLKRILYQLNGSAETMGNLLRTYP